ncbi:MAG: hypothetical protein JKY65_10840 [Planctomycetes bacterium]|nr:hypothetical protein [Planctomycetota bacterium]
MSATAQALEVNPGLPLDLVEVVTWSPEEVEEALLTSPPPALEELLGWEFYGYNLPDFTSLIGIRKFVKGFLPGVGEELLRGYNVRVRPRGGPLDPWDVVRGRSGEPVRHGFFDVGVPLPPDIRYPQSFLLDYDCGRNPAWDPSVRLRDYLVAVGPDTLLGKAYLAFGRRRVPVSTFVLQRAGRASGH